MGVKSPGDMPETFGRLFNDRDKDGLLGLYTEDGTLTIDGAETARGKDAVGAMLEPMLDKVATTYDEQVETTVSSLTALLEPLLILVMVGIVLVIILATLMPLLQITNSLN